MSVTPPDPDAIPTTGPINLAPLPHPQLPTSTGLTLSDDTDAAAAISSSTIGAPASNIYHLTSGMLGDRCKMLDGAPAPDDVASSPLLSGRVSVDVSPVVSGNRSSAQCPTEATAFTKHWIEQIFSTADANVSQTSKLSLRDRNERRHQYRWYLFKQTLRPTTETNQLLMKLKLDYELAPGYTLLPCILDAVCRYEKKSADDDHPYRLERSQRCAMMSQLYENLRLNGYTNGLKPFHPDRIWIPEMEAGPTFTAIRQTNILAFILGLAISPIERTFLIWIDKLITTILEQPSISKEVKYELVNQLSDTPPHQATSLLSKQTILQSVITLYSAYPDLPIGRMLLKYGADVHFVSPATDVLPPLMRAAAVGNIALLIEMILTQPNLMEIDLMTQLKSNNAALTRHSTQNSRTQPFIQTGVGKQPKGAHDDRDWAKHHSTPTRLVQQIISRLHKWQVEQRSQLTADSNSQPDDASIRDWLREPLSSLPNQLFSSNLQYLIREFKLHTAHTPHTEVMPDLIQRWSEQLSHGPQHIHLTEISGDQQQYLTTLLVDSLELFLEPSFRSYVPQVLGMLNEVPFVQILALFSSSGTTNCLSFLNACANQFEVISKVTDPIERVERGQILVQFLDRCMRLLNRILTEDQSRTKEKMDEYLNEMKVLYGYDLNDHTHDHELSDSLSHRIATIVDGVQPTLLSLVKKMSWVSTVEVFKEIWYNILPQLATFRERQTNYYYESLRLLIISSYAYFTETTKYKYRSSADDVIVASHRTLSFLDSCVFQTSDLWSPFQLVAFDGSSGRLDADAFNLTSYVLVQMNALREHARFEGNAAEYLLEKVMEMESQWRTIIWPAIRTNVEMWIIKDLAGIVMNYLQPAATSSHPWSTSTSTSSVLASGPSSVLQPPSFNFASPINFNSWSSSSLFASTTSAASSSTVAAPSTTFNFSSTPTINFSFPSTSGFSSTIGAPPTNPSASIPGFSSGWPFATNSSTATAVTFSSSSSSGPFMFTAPPSTPFPSSTTTAITTTTGSNSLSGSDLDSGSDSDSNTVRWISSTTTVEYW